MSNYELLVYLKQHIKYFDNISESDFNILFILENCDFSCNNDYLYKVTPLLKQMAEYALIPITLTPEEIDEIDSLLENQEDTILTEALEFSGYCHDYISRLIDSNYNHPCATSLKLTERISVLYEDMMDDITEIIEKTTDPILLEKIFDLYTSIDNSVCDNIDKSFRETVLKADEYKIKTVKEMLIELLKYCTNAFIERALLSKVNSYSVIENKAIFFFNSTENASFLKLISLASATANLPISSELELLLNNLIEKYKLYSHYRYYYFENDIQQKKYLLRCSQM